MTTTRLSVTTTRTYGSWARYGDGCHTESIMDTIEALGPHAGDFDVQSLHNEWVDAVSAALPDGMAFNGRDFTGTREFDDDEQLRAIIRDALDAVDFWAIAQRHDTTAAAGE